MDRMEYLPEIYKTLQENEHRSFLVVLSRQEPSPQFLRWLEEEDINDLSHLHYNISSLLMEPNGSSKDRPEGWKERTTRFLAQIEDLDCYKGYLECFESLIEADDKERASQVKREKLTLALSEDLEGGLRLTKEWASKQCDPSDNDDPFAESGSGNRFDSLVRGLLENSSDQPNGYAAWRDPVFASAMQRVALGEGTIEEAIQLYDDRLRGLDSEVRKFLIEQALKSAIEFDPFSAMPVAVQRLGVGETVRRYPLGHGWTKISLSLMKGLMATEAWTPMLEEAGENLSDKFLSDKAKFAFGDDETATLEWARSLPLPNERRRSLKAIAACLNADGRDSEAEALIQETAR